MTSRAPAAVLDGAAADLEALAGRLEPHAVTSRYDGTNGLGLGRAGVDPIVIERHPFLGASNPLAPPLLVVRGDEGPVGTVTLDARHEGIPGRAHGGWIAALFDQVLGVAAAGVAGRPAMTGTLTIRFLHPTPVGRELRFDAQATRTGARTLHATATLTAATTVTAEAEAVLVMAREAQFRPPGAEAP